MKEIHGYDGHYYITKDGRVWSSPKYRIKNGRYLKPWLVGHGYESVMLYKDKKPKKFLVHRLVATAFISNPESLLEVNHKDGDIRNNTVDNLEWVSSKENKRQAWDMGLYSHKGKKHYKTKLSEKDVLEIRRMWKDGVKQPKIAEKFGITKGSVSVIVTRKTWKHVP